MLKTLLKRFANHLKIMVDETFGEPVAEALNNDVAFIKAKTTFDCGCVQGTKDPILIVKAKQENRVLLTFDRNTIDKKRYPPCTHAGIIIIEGKHWSPESIVKQLKAFSHSGDRKLLLHSVTYLHRDHAVIHQHDGKQDLISF
jgi:predicted nuclease of predicted toxin-antitoxin system